MSFPDIARFNRVVRAGHPALSRIAEPIADPTAPEITALAAHMVEQMEQACGVGLAAPQLGISLRMVVFFVPERRLTGREGDVAHPLTVLINPQIELLGDALEDGMEGCLSLPDLRGVVPRHLWIRYRGLDVEGREIDRTVSGFHARVVQHETDHLDGILYPVRMNDLRSLVYSDEMLRAGLEKQDG